MITNKEFFKDGLERKRKDVPDGQESSVKSPVFSQEKTHKAKT